MPRGVDERLQELLDRQDAGDTLSQNERLEAEGLVELTEFLLRLRSKRIKDAQKIAGVTTEVLNLNRPMILAIRVEEIALGRHPF